MRSIMAQPCDPLAPLGSQLHLEGVLRETHFAVSISCSLHGISRAYVLDHINLLEFRTEKKLRESMHKSNAKLDEGFHGQLLTKAHPAGYHG